MAASGYDEDLAENAFLKALRAKHSKVYQAAALRRATVRGCAARPPLQQAGAGVRAARGQRQRVIAEPGRL